MTKRIVTVPFRIDLETRILEINDDDRTFRGVLVPDSRRYEEVSSDGKTYLRDKYLGYLFESEKFLQTFAEQAKGQPIYSLRSSVRSTEDYARNRKEALTKELETGQYVPPEETALAHKELEVDVDAKWLVFLSVDVCGGSALRTRDAAAFDKAYALFFRELATVVGQFNGHIFQPTGDGFIAFIDHPSFNQQADQAVDMGLSLLHVLQQSVNPALLRADLPDLNIRVGADCGYATSRRIDVPTTQFSAAEIASDALNKAVKIQEAASENSFLIGKNLYGTVHVQWLERAHQVDFDGASVGSPDYRVYCIR